MNVVNAQNCGSYKKEIDRLEKIDNKIETLDQLGTLYRAAIHELCEEWQEVKPLQTGSECKFLDQKNKGCEMVAGKMIQFLGSHLIDKNGKISKVKFGEGYFSKVISFKETITKKDDFNFYSHVAAIVKLKDSSEYVLDMVENQNIPTSLRKFKEFYDKYKVNLQDVIEYKVAKSYNSPFCSLITIDNILRYRAIDRTFTLITGSLDLNQIKEIEKINKEKIIIKIN